jgi:hypothetical protein
MGVTSVDAAVVEQLQNVNGEDQLVGILELMNDTTIRQDCHTRTDSKDEYHPSSPVRSRPKITIALMVLTL